MAPGLNISITLAMTGRNIDLEKGGISVMSDPEVVAVVVLIGLTCSSRHPSRRAGDN
jgi:hypothetical protein